MAANTAIAYWKKLWPDLLRHAEPWARDNIAFAGAMSIAPLPLVALMYGRNVLASVDWKLIKSTMVLYSAALVIYFLFQLFKAASRLDQVREKEETELRLRISTLEDSIRPRLEIGKPSHFEYTIAQVKTRAYRIPVRNVSASATIKNVNVLITNIEPTPPEYTWGSTVRLHWKDDNKPKAALGLATFSSRRDLQAGTPEEADFVYASEGARDISVFHTAENIDQKIPRLRGKYRISIEVKGDDVPSASAAFDIWFDEAHILQCVAVEGIQTDDQQPRVQAARAT